MTRKENGRAQVFKATFIGQESDLKNLKYLVNHGLSLKLYKPSFLSVNQKQVFYKQMYNIGIKFDTNVFYSGDLFLRILLNLDEGSYSIPTLKRKFIEYTANNLGKNILNTKYIVDDKTKNILIYASNVYVLYLLGYKDLALKFEIKNEPVIVTLNQDNHAQTLIYLANTAIMKCDLDTFKKTKTAFDMLNGKKSKSFRDLAYEKKCDNIVDYLKELGVKHHLKKYVELNELDDIE